MRVLGPCLHGGLSMLRVPDVVVGGADACPGMVAPHGERGPPERGAVPAVGGAGLLDALDAKPSLGIEGEEGSAGAQEKPDDEEGGHSELPTAAGQPPEKADGGEGAGQPSPA